MGSWGGGGGVEILLKSLHETENGIKATADGPLGLNADFALTLTSYGLNFYCGVPDNVYTPNSKNGRKNHYIRLHVNWPSWPQSHLQKNEAMRAN